MSWRRFFGRRRADAELTAEMESYLAEEAAENRMRGMPEEEAKRQARIKLGNAGSVRERLWRQNTIPWLDSLVRDFRYGVRTLLRTPGFTLIAIGVMALCIGATTSLFTVVRSVLLRPLPFRDPGRLVMLYEHFRDPSMNSEEFNYNTVAPADFYDWRAQTHGFEDMAAWRYAQFNLTGAQGELPEQVDARGGTWNLFSLLGVKAALGRGFTESEDRPDGTVAMLTWSLFERRFAGDASIVGRQIHLDGKLYTVVGVLPKWFTWPDAKVQIWVPFASGHSPELMKHHDYHFLRVVARLRPDVSLASALSQVSAVQYRLHVENMPAPVAEDVVSRTLIQDLAHTVEKPLMILLCAAACMLLIGSLNVANLLVARAAARQNEIAIREALGAGRLVLIRGQMMESLLICAAGGAAGMGLSLAATRWLASAWKELPTAQGIHVDGLVLAFACGLTAAAALLAGLLPALTTTRRKTTSSLHASSRSGAGSRTHATLRKTLLTVEIATTVVLLIGAGLLLKSFWRLRTTDLGCTTQKILTMGYSLPAKQYGSPEKVNAFDEALLERVKSMPGVRAAGLGSVVPGAGAMEDDVFTIREHPPISAGAALPDALFRMASTDYFKALQIPILKGRFFTNDDRAGQPKTVIISRQLARQYFPGENPLGKHLHLVPYGDADYEIVGVVGDMLYKVGQPARPTMYFPVLNGDQNVGLTLVVRASTDPLALCVPIQREIAELDPQLPVTDVLTMQQIIGDSLGNQQLSATLVLSFAILSMVLAAVGLYGVISYLTTQRRTEIGIRIALGARREEVMRLMLLDGLRPALLGLGFGLVASVLAVRLIKSMLAGAQTLDPAVFAAVACTLLAVSALACLIPAWRAARIDPMQALRME
jgi:predicted permease